ncbi:MAG: hypothetical protein LBG93_01700 [Treponema sp.]|jgi:ribosomal 50S subunit-associated protein YjgA (DUF615 family)|nr:hypothetical protein [Treponema sp.]
MPENELADVLKNNVTIPENQIKRLFDLLRDCKKETEITQREAKKYDAIKETMMAEISSKYAFYEFLFSKIFAERSEAIKKDFEIIDQGLKQKNRSLVADGVTGLSQIVSSSPIQDIEKLRRLLG